MTEKVVSGVMKAVSRSVQVASRGTTSATTVLGVHAERVDVPAASVPIAQEDEEGDTILYCLQQIYIYKYNEDIQDFIAVFSCFNNHDSADKEEFYA